MTGLWNRTCDRSKGALHGGKTSIFVLLTNQEELFSCLSFGCLAHGKEEEAGNNPAWRIMVSKGIEASLKTWRHPRGSCRCVGAARQSVHSGPDLYNISLPCMCNIKLVWCCSLQPGECVALRMSRDFPRGTRARG